MDGLFAGMYEADKQGWRSGEHFSVDGSDEPGSGGSFIGHTLRQGL